MRKRIGLDGLAQLYKQMEPELKKAIRRGLKSATLRAKIEVIHQIDHAHPYPAVDTGELRNSVSVNLSKNEISVDAPHAIFMEKGTRPFTPPIAPLLTWVIRKGLATEDEAWGMARAIQRKIALEGIAPRHFMRKAMDIVHDRIVPEEIGRELQILEETGIV